MKGEAPGTVEGSGTGVKGRVLVKGSSTKYSKVDLLTTWKH